MFHGCHTCDFEFDIGHFLSQELEGVQDQVKDKGIYEVMVKTVVNMRKSLKLNLKIFFYLEIQKIDRVWFKGKIIGN